MKKTSRAIILTLAFFALHVLVRMMGDKWNPTDAFIFGYTWGGWEFELWKLAGTLTTVIVCVALALGFGWNLDALLKKSKMRQN
jgi:hypothetical protein